MRIIHFSLPILVLTSLVLLSSCTGSDSLGSRKSNEMRIGVSGSGKSMNDSGSYRRGNHERTESPYELVSTSVGISETITPTESTPTGSTQAPVTPQITPSVVAPVTQKVETVTPVQASSTTSKTVTYSTDRGKERATVKFDISLDGTKTITAITATMTSGDRESGQYVSRFNSAAKSKIIGKKVAGLSLSAVGGASDTTDAFSQIIASL